MPRTVTLTSSTAADAMTAALGEVRARTLRLVAHLGDPDCERSLDPLMSPLAWDLGHIAAYEDLWLVHRHAGRPLLRPDLAALYDAFETPRAVRADLDILSRPEAEEHLAAVRERTLEAIASHGVGPALHEMVLRHELQHTETMRQAMRLGGLLPPGEPALAALDGDGLEALEVRGGAFALGAPAGRFSYDNERPRHAVHLPPFRIGRTPVTNATWLTFAEGGGYERREWWSDEGWAWKEEYDITHPWGWPAAPVVPDHPVMHVSWFEADAFARAHDARLPTEAQWERASASIQGTGQVWEWTSSPFAPYPGFAAHPYREYSEVFFGDRYRVLRGASWATHPRVADPTFRNWDLPQRRQLFAGVRLAWDVAT
jgi:gamma-glutamyl hercynylcysteine S-oxide synthase